MEKVFVKKGAMNFFFGEGLENFEFFNVRMDGEAKLKPNFLKIFGDNPGFEFQEVRKGGFSGESAVGVFKCQIDLSFLLVGI